MASPSPMNRLLQGDVGSGKTVVAMAAALFAQGMGQQTALMAPTELLAQQHFDQFPEIHRGKNSGGASYRRNTIRRKEEDLRYDQLPVRLTL